MTTKSLSWRIALFLICYLTFLSAIAQKNSSKNDKFGEDQIKKLNQICFNCHGNTHYELKDTATGKVFKKMMMYVIAPSAFYQSNHKDFKCIDCHSDEFKTFPHPLALRFEEVPNCIDCHGGDAKYAKYNFEKINDDFQRSVHSTKHRKEFTCWMCHDAHFYKINARNNKQDLSKTIAYDNSICLSCHANVDKYQLILNKQNPNIIEKHDWLPNQENHFRNVRCIECHARINDTILVSHDIQPKEKAVKRCVECHSRSTILLQTLYKYQSKERLSKGGFFNAVTLNNVYIVGANRNYYINLAVIIILSLTIIGIIIHSILRVLKKSKKEDYVR